MNDQRLVRYGDWKMPEGVGSDLVSLHEEGEHLKITVARDDKTFFEITFFRNEAYRKTDEGNALPSLQLILPGEHSCILFEMFNSEYAKWLSDQSGGMLDSVKLRHFCIGTDFDWIDVLCLFEPTVTCVKA